VLGEPGVGKSRLLDETLAVIGSREVRATKCFRLVAPAEPSPRNGRRPWPAGP